MVKKGEAIQETPSLEELARRAIDQFNNRRLDDSGFNVYIP